MKTYYFVKTTVVEFFVFQERRNPNIGYRLRPIVIEVN